MNDEFFTRGVSEIIERKSLEEKLKSGKKLRIKMGVDPTRPDIHLGHVVGIRKLKEFQDAGHQVIFLLGDFTAKVGDPSGKSKTRPMLSDEEIMANAKSYLEQVGKILDVEKTELRRNSEWFSKMDFNDILKIAAKFTVAQIIERDDFENRLKNGIDVGLHEILYPVMQAYDSVMLEADVELGGTDQKFNMLAGRDLQRKMGQLPQDVITVPLLVGLDGKEKMSKSLDNYIGVDEAPEEQFGKVMSVPDTLIVPYFELATTVPGDEIAQFAQEMESGANPRDIKERLAYEIVKMYHGDEAAKQAQDIFIQRFREKKIAGEIPEVDLSGEFVLPQLLVKLEAAVSSSEARRLIEQGAVRIDDQKLEDVNATLEVKPGMIIQVGKRKVYRVK